MRDPHYISVFEAPGGGLDEIRPSAFGAEARADPEAG
jgi:hypothetical protein